MTSTAVSRPRVYVRIRPLNERELVDGKGETMCRGSAAQRDVLLLRKSAHADELQARFDRVFESSDSQAAVYDTIGYEVQQTLMSGYSASVFAYGQTGSGKTYTMEGDRAGYRRRSSSSTSHINISNTNISGRCSDGKNNDCHAHTAASAGAVGSESGECSPTSLAVPPQSPTTSTTISPVSESSTQGKLIQLRSQQEGSEAATATSSFPYSETGGLVPRLLHGIFEHFRTSTNITNALVQLSLVQIYQERIQDLLNVRQNLEIHMDRTGQYVARDATWRTVRGVNECMKLYADGCAMRATSSTEMNFVSSRSHMILMLRLHWDEPALPGSRAQLNLVDLAGSERLHVSKATGETMVEAIHINKSLSALSNVVMKLVEQARHPRQRVHIPYKDSKLTYLLQSSLGGANLIHFVLTISSSALWRGETISTIEFGKRALQLVLRPVRNAIDFTRLTEMEAMIENMRCHIASLEEQLRTKQSSEVTHFLQLRQLAKDEMAESLQPLPFVSSPASSPKRSSGTMTTGATTSIKRDGSRGRANAQRRVRAKPHRHRQPASRRHRHLAQQTELMRIMANLPETFDDLTSHCVLFPESKEAFCALGGLQQLVYFINHCASSYYRANAAHTLASVMSESGRLSFAPMGGTAALARLLQVPEERCKESACVALEAVCRGCVANKDALPLHVYADLADLVYNYPNQQVQEMACAAIATIADGYPAAVERFDQANVVPKLLHTIRHCPAEVVNLTKAATNCIGRLAHTTSSCMQQAIAQHGGIDLLIDVLFSRGGEADHQVPILASYALVNVCCGLAENMAMVRAHPRYPAVKFSLLEGLARAFGSNTAREGFGRATAQETHAPFSYYGVTVLGKWTESNSGGRPIFATFMDNPQFYLYVHEGDCNSNTRSSDSHAVANSNTDKDSNKSGRSGTSIDVAFIIQDTLYESRLRQKRRNNAVYMGLAIFEGNAELSRAGLKQLDFHGTMLEMSRYTSNCENVLHVSLEPHATPYVVVPFTSQVGRCTSFALSVFGDGPVELTAVPESTGWVHTTLQGSWNEWNGRGGDGFDWRCNPQLRLRARESCRVVVVLSYCGNGNTNRYNHTCAEHNSNRSNRDCIDNNSADVDDANRDNNADQNKKPGSSNSNDGRRANCVHSNRHARATNENKKKASTNETSFATSDNECSTSLRAAHCTAPHTHAIDADTLETSAESVVTRPRLHGRLFRNAFAPDRRYLRALVPLPQLANFVASNSFASTSYIATSARLQAGEDYVYIPFTEVPHVADYRVSLYCDSDEVELRSLTSACEESEWLCCGLAGAWAGRAVAMEVQTTPGRLVAVVYSPGTFVRMKLYQDEDAANAGDSKKSHTNAAICVGNRGVCAHTKDRHEPDGSHTNHSNCAAVPKLLAGMETYWNSEASLVYDCTQHDAPAHLSVTFRLVVEGVTRAERGSVTAPAGPIPACQGDFDIVFFTDNPCKVTQLDFPGKPSRWPFPTRTTPKELLHYPQLVDDCVMAECDGGDAVRRTAADWRLLRGGEQRDANGAIGLDGYAHENQGSDGDACDEDEEDGTSSASENQSENNQSRNDDSTTNDDDNDDVYEDESDGSDEARNRAWSAKMKRVMNCVKRENAKLRRTVAKQARQMASLVAAAANAANTTQSTLPSVSREQSHQQRRRQQQQGASSLADMLTQQHTDGGVGRCTSKRVNVAAAALRLKRNSLKSTPASHMHQCNSSSSAGATSATTLSTSIAPVSNGNSSIHHESNRKANTVITCNDVASTSVGDAQEVEQHESVTVPSSMARSLSGQLTPDWGETKLTMQCAVTKLRTIGLQMTQLTSCTSVRSDVMTEGGGDACDAVAQTKVESRSQAERDMLCARLQREVQDVHAELLGLIQRCEVALITLPTSDVPKVNGIAKTL